MGYSFSNCTAESDPVRRVPASGIDQEAVHRIRQLGRIERAKIVRHCLVAIGRLATAAHLGGSIS